MKIKTILLLVAAAVLVILIIQVAVQYSNVQKGGTPATRRRATVNWLLLCIMTLSFAGSFYTTNQPLRITQAAVSQSKTNQTSSQSSSNLTLDTPSKAVLQNGAAKVEITVPQGTKLQICNGNTVLANVDNSKETSNSKLTYRFDQAGIYKIVGTRHNQRFTKRLEITAPQRADASSSSSEERRSSAGNPSAPAQTPSSGNSTTAPSSVATSANNTSPVPGYHYEYRTVKVPIN